MPLLIEVGAFDGHDSFNFYNMGYTVYTFEPKKDLYDNLCAKTKNCKNYTVINKAVSLIDGDVDFYICKRGGASSILKFKENEELIKHWGNSRDDIHYSNTCYKVQSTRLDTFIEENNLQNEQIDYLHIDAQGVDLDVMKSLGKYISNVKKGVLETAYTYDKAIYLEQTSFLEEVKDWLQQHNFKIDQIKNNDATKCEVNIYFSRK